MKKIQLIKLISKQNFCVDFNGYFQIDVIRKVYCSKIKKSVCDTSDIFLMFFHQYFICLYQLIQYNATPLQHILLIHLSSGKEKVSVNCKQDDILLHGIMHQHRQAAITLLAYSF